MTRADRLLHRSRDNARRLAEVVLNRHGNRRAEFRNYLFLGTRRLVRSFEIQSGAARFVLNTADTEVSRILFIYGFYERQLMESVHRQLSKLEGRPFSLEGKEFVDVGANLGSACVEACVNFGAATAVALEPEAENVSFINRNLAANGLLDRVRVHQVAVSDAAGELALELSQDNRGDHRVRLQDPAEDDLGESLRQIVTVPAQSLDGLCADGELDVERVGLVWVDVQGHEAQVLAGGGRLIEAGVPLLVEYWPYGLRATGNLERFHEQVAQSFTHVLDMSGPLDDPVAELMPPGEIPRLQDRYRGAEGLTDLLLLRR